ncbi:MAG: N-acetyltransferase [Limnochordia bacterium]|nr:N-acetyltransferase [Limnochordia bacterium]MDD2629688.1 N-acetyltransferase [Limnochordia bacterium]MDD4518065.1 N-acetyltransferase [Limnochordia bacterium]
MNYLIRQEEPEDYGKVREVLRSAFSREGKDPVFNEWNLVEKIRASQFYIRQLSLVSEVDGIIVGHILFSTMTINGPKTVFNTLALAPLAVHRDYQRQGVGRQLVRSAIERAKRLGFRSMIVMGDPDYYCKFGFEPAAKRRIGTTEDFADPCLLALELVKDGLLGVSGIVQYCPLFYNENRDLI